MCTANLQKNLPDFMTNLQGTSVSVPDSGKPRAIRNATDVPLGEGLADAAKTSILNRRARIKEAVDAGGRNPNAFEVQRIQALQGDQKNALKKQTHRKRMGHLDSLINN